MIVGRQLSADVEEAGRDANEVIVEGGGVEVASIMEELIALDGIEEGGNDVTSFGSSTFIVTSSISIPALAACLLVDAIAGQLTLSVSVGSGVLMLAV
jgi:hypothetical protein